jgi:hypothetical protein
MESDKKKITDEILEHLREKGIKKNLRDHANFCEGFADGMTCAINYIKNEKNYDWN